MYRVAHYGRLLFTAPRRACGLCRVEQSMLSAYVLIFTATAAAATNVQMMLATTNCRTLYNMKKNHRKNAEKRKNLIGGDAEMELKKMRIDLGRRACAGAAVADALTAGADYFLNSGFKRAWLTARRRSPSRCCALQLGVRCRSSGGRSGEGTESQIHLETWTATARQPPAPSCCE